MKRALLILSLLLACACPASAHVFLDHSQPRVGSHSSSAPREVRIWFTGPVEPAFSSIAVLDSSGKRVDNKDTHANSSDATELVATVPSLPAGAYKVQWQAVSTDTHKTSGDFKFYIDP